MTITKKWLLLDRDGTIIVDKKYLSDPDGVELLPGVAEGLKRLQDMGFIFTVVSNQSGVGRGFFDEEDVVKVNARLIELLNHFDIILNGIYFCPHAPQEHCGCRKPQIGLVERAMRDLHLTRSDIACVVGDKESDVELARRLNVPGVLVGQITACAAKYFFRDLREVAEWLLSAERSYV